MTRTSNCMQILLYFFFTGVFPCNGVSWLQQLEHIVRTRRESEGINNNLVSRRSFFKYDPQEVSKILGVPQYPNQLPEAEPVQPGHTLIRPSLGMLKSSVKFPHRDLEDGSGVYGNIENLGLRYDGTNERVLYTGFRRMPSDYIMVIPEKNTRQSSKPRIRLVPTIIDLGNENSVEKVLAQLKKLELSGNTNLFIVSLLDNISYQTLVEKPKSYYLSGSELDKPREQLLYRLQPVKPIKEYLNLRNNIPERSQESDDDDKIFDDNVKAKEKENESAKQKFFSFLNTQDAFNHIKLNEGAPDHTDFLPSMNVNENIRDWWFYNQDDYEPFISI